MNSFNLDLFASKTFMCSSFYGSDNNFYLRIKEVHYIFHISITVAK